MRKRMYMILLAAVLTLGLSSGCMTAFASQTEADGAGQAQGGAAMAAGDETEPELSTEAALLEPTSVTGDSSVASLYPTLEAQVEQQLETLSKMSAEDVEKRIYTYNRQINLSVLDLKNSMKDSSTLNAEDDATMAMVKMLRNWYSNMDSCGEFKGIKSYTADMTDNIITMTLDADYAIAEENDSQITVVFTYDTERNVTLLTWDVKDSFSANVGRAGMNTLIGLGTVFVVLLFLTFIISQIHWIPDIVGRKKKEESAPATAAPSPAPAPAAVEESVEEEVDDLELIAVISAAIAASEQAPADGFVVRSIRRRGRKSNWRA